MDDVLSQITVRFGALMQELGLVLSVVEDRRAITVRFEVDDYSFLPIVLIFEGPALSGCERATWAKLEVVELCYSLIELGNTSWVHWEESGESSYHPQGSLEDTFTRIGAALRESEIVTLANDMPKVVNSPDFAHAWCAVHPYVCIYGVDGISIEREADVESYVFKDTLGREIRLNFPLRTMLGELLINGQRTTQFDQSDADGIASALSDVLWDVPRSSP
ncbi:hypothetical protein LAC81_28945 [Ensifer adhaerens]|uniref:hypothetical protein n=1 Tax=Ensifer adhaerens TaxID=106592 RepID=UPI001CC12F47|nr:hypothetical protein [Ensifer adhaerens]MBZ7924768.1 hypothetical protein [Ensifer adhaerens]UAX96009.1 hypothetical protein LAC78_34885 [Ensifer adhaerens]UAY04650.1 hypothetical protein LAC80_25425 [Ensifer adhaerens]UAY10081.1 hypothetical protein LAC81_28945 [Ensifer adhaerens]